MSVATDPFTALGIEPRFDLDLEQLHQCFIAAAVTVHPDRFIDPIDQADAAAQAAEINEAYATLADPERRANALLLLVGGSAKEDDKSLPPEFLMDMMEVREQMEQAIGDADHAELHRLRQWAGDQRQRHVQQISSLFKTQDAKAIRQELNALRYIERMLEQMPVVE